MTTSGGYGQQTPADVTSDFAKTDFHISQRLRRVRTMQPAKVLSVQAGGKSKYSTVSIQPMIKQTDQQGNVVSHGEVFNIPVMRWGAGDGSIIMDPAVGDLGFVGVSDRDISSFKSSKGESAPGSKRMFSFSDAVYFGKIQGEEPAQWIMFDANGIEISDRNGNTIVLKSGEVDLTATTFKVTGNLVVTGNLQLGGVLEAVAGGTYGGALQTSGDVIAGAGGADSVTLQNHVHTSATSGSPTSAPTAGT